LEVTSRTVSVTTTSTTAAHTALAGNVTPVDLPHIKHPPATIWADFTVTVIAITKPGNAEMHTTKTAHAFSIVRQPKLSELAQISVDIMISTPDSVSTI